MATGILVAGCSDNMTALEAPPEETAKSSAALEGCVATLTPSVAAPQKVGTPVRWTVSSTGCGATPVYRFSARTDSGQPFRMIRDFAKRTYVDWTPMIEGDAKVKVEVKPDYTSTDPSTTTASFTVQAHANLPAVTPAAKHPLVALYSAPPCKKHRSVHVEFVEAPGPGEPTHHLPWRSTSEQDCIPGKSMNFWVAGMKPQTTYWMRHDDGSSRWRHGYQVFTTGAMPADVTLPAFSIAKPIDDLTDTHADIAWNALIRSVAATAAIPLATDLAGTPLWYWHIPTFAAELSTPQPIRMAPGGLTSVYARDAESIVGTQSQAWTVLRKFDLDGSPKWEVNSNALSIQTETGDRPFHLWGFHHDTVDLDDGSVAMIGYSLRCISPDFSTSIDASSFTCPAGTALWLGDAIVVVDSEGRLQWKWNGFDAGHFDPARPAPLAYTTCNVPLNGECPIVGARSYTHANALGVKKDWDEESCRRRRRPVGSVTQLVLNSRFQNWTIKVAYEDGEGDGSVLWRMGAGGSFTTSDPANWYSHAHNTHFIGDGTFLVFDNGNNRCAGFDFHFCPSSSRGQVWKLNERTMTAEPKLNFSFDDVIGSDGAPFKAFSDSLGSAQKLTNGNYLFDIGAVKPSTCGNATCNEPRHTYVAEVGTRDGVSVQSFTYKLGLRNYRAYRMHTLYEGHEQ